MSDGFGYFTQRELNDVTSAEHRFVSYWFPCETCGARAWEPCLAINKKNGRKYPVPYFHMKRKKLGHWIWEEFRQKLIRTNCPLCGRRMGFPPHRCPNDQEMQKSAEAQAGVLLAKVWEIDPGATITPLKEGIAIDASFGAFVGDTLEKAAAMALEVGMLAMPEGEDEEE